MVLKWGRGPVDNPRAAHLGSRHPQEPPVPPTYLLHTSRAASVANAATTDRVPVVHDGT